MIEIVSLHVTLKSWNAIIELTSVNKKFAKDFEKRQFRKLVSFDSFWSEPFEMFRILIIQSKAHTKFQNFEMHNGPKKANSQLPGSCQTKHQFRIPCAIQSVRETDQIICDSSAVTEMSVKLQWRSLSVALFGQSDGTSSRVIQVLSGRSTSGGANWWARLSRWKLVRLKTCQKAKGSRWLETNSFLILISQF